MLPALRGAVDVGKILDRYWICTDSDPLQNELMISSFFDDLSGEYREIIEPARNAENVRHLLWLLLDHLGAPAGTLLDFGCGPGVSRALVAERGRSVVGVDLSRRMRELAAETGMDVIAPEEVRSFDGEEFAGAFASYVLHLDPRPADLRPVLSTLRPGGVLVANVHKDRGLETLRSYLDGAGCDSEPLPPPGQDVHGSYLAIHVRN
jgi:SAM-dependent methyltransferase